MRCENLEWIQLAHNRFHWRCPVNILMKHIVPWKVGKCFASRATVNFLRRFLLLGTYFVIDMVNIQLFEKEAYWSVLIKFRSFFWTLSLDVSISLRNRNLKLWGVWSMVEFQNWGIIAVGYRDIYIYIYERKEFVIIKLSHNKLRRMRWAGHVAPNGQRRNAYKILIRVHEMNKKTWETCT